MLVACACATNLRPWNLSSSLSLLSKHERPPPPASPLNALRARRPRLHADRMPTNFHFFVKAAADSVDKSPQDNTSGRIFTLNDEREDWFDNNCLFHPIVLHDPNSRTSNKWRMYYYGRYDDTWNDGLAPALLTTGYIGLAVSPDGLKWKRCKGPHTRGAIFGPNTDVTSFDHLHVGCGDVIRISDEEYWMYYFGGSLEELSLAPGKVTKGFKMRPGFAKSSDGLNFKRGKSLPLLELGQTGEWDELFVAWPRVIPPSAPEAMTSTFGADYNDGSKRASNRLPPTSDSLWLMTYSSIEKTVPPKSSIGLAHSMDGITNWSKRGKILEAGDEGSWDECGVGRRHVIKHDGQYLMFYEGVDKLGLHSIGLAVSEDGIVWEKDARSGDQPGGPVFSPKHGTHAWDSAVVAAPHVVALDGRFRMYYVGQDLSKSRYAIGVAISDESNFRKWKRYHLH